MGTWTRTGLVVLTLFLVLWFAACESTPKRNDTGTDSKAREGRSRAARTDPAPEPSPTPPKPQVPDFAAEHDKSRPPEVPGAITIPLEHGAPHLPAEGPQQFIESLEAKWEVSKSTNRGESNSGLHRYEEFRWENYVPLCICESRAIDDWKYGHGRAVLTFDRLAKDSLLTDWSLAGRNTLAIGYLRFGKMHGPWMFRKVEQARKGEAGPLYFICEYVSGVAHGECRWYTPDGRPKGQSFYKGGKHEGERLERVAGGIIRRQFTGGVEDGQYSMWNDAGQLVARAMSYNGRYWGKAEIWHPGTIRYYRVRHFRHDTQSHWEACYNKDGLLLDQRWVEEDAYTGPFIEYYPGSFIKASGTLKKGQYDGVVYFKFKDRPANESAASYKEGKREGGYWEYYESGKLKVQATYRNDVLDGPYKTYAEDGKLISEQRYEDGEIFDPTRQWPAPNEVLDASGKPIQRKYGHWRTETQPTMPTAEVGMAMAYHEKLGGVVMFGGRKVADTNSVVNETWLRKDGRWQRIFEGRTAPMARENAAMAYDSRRGVIVMFGGNYAVRDTWELGVGGWTQRTKTPLTANPDPRVAAAMVYDSRRGVCVLIGGLGPDADFKDTELKSAVWEWDGTDWNWAGSGPLVHSASAAYDEQRRRVVLNGGMGLPADGSSKVVQELFDTWTYDGQTWKVVTFLSPPKAFGHAMVYDADQRAVVVVRNEWLGTNIELRASLPERSPFFVNWRPTREDRNPPLRGNFKAAYDRKTREIVVYGGEVIAANKWVPARSTLILTDESPADRVVETTDAKRAVEAVPGWKFHDNGEFATSGFSCQTVIYDHKRGVPVMLGSANVAHELSSTGRKFVVYERHDGVWKHIRTTTAPYLREAFAIWFDDNTQRVTLYGGDSGKETLTDLWEWDGSSWRCVNETTPDAPLTSAAHPWAWDPKRRVLVTQCYTETAVLTYEWSGGRWTNTGVELPKGFAGGQMLYDPVHEKVLLAYPVDLNIVRVSRRAFHWNGAAWAAADQLVGLPPTGGNETLYPDIAGKALWQLGEDGLRKYDGTKWSAWQKPTGLRASFDQWQWRLWIVPGDAVVSCHGYRLSPAGSIRNDTLVFDPAKGKKIK